MSDNNSPIIDFAINAAEIIIPSVIAGVVMGFGLESSGMGIAVGLADYISRHRYDGRHRWQRPLIMALVFAAGAPLLGTGLFKTGFTAGAAFVCAEIADFLIQNSKQPPSGNEVLSC